MNRLRLTLACADSDRVVALRQGTISPEGIDLNVLTLPVEEVFYRMVVHREFDVAEMSLSSYVASLCAEKPPFVALPVFLSRAFRHSGVFVHGSGKIRRPKDLLGGRVGTPEYEMTAGVWIRGILAEYYQLPVGGVTYLTGGLEQPGRTAKTSLQLPSAIHVQAIPADQTLTGMLTRGEIDALYTARMPSAFVDRHPSVRRLFDDAQGVEIDYFRKTGIFPIMHTVVIRRDVYDQNRWLAQSLMKALVRAQREGYSKLYETSALHVMLPWLPAHMEETHLLMGDDYWPYGLERNSNTLRTFLTYALDQGIIDRAMELEELFAPESLSEVRI